MKSENEEGQASVEYILMISIVVLMASLLIHRLIQPYAVRLTKILQTKIEKTLFPADFHYLKLKRE